MSDFSINTYPKSRLATHDVGQIGQKKHHITGLLEVDVTLARARIRELIRTGSDISFSAWLIKVIGQTIVDHPQVQAINTKGRKQILFQDVDISLPLERTINGIQVPLAALIPAVNTKSMAEIKHEIEAARQKPVKHEQDFVLKDRHPELATRLFFNLPAFMRKIFWKFLLSNPFHRKRYMGTAIITNIGMSGGLSGWIIPKSIHNLCFGMGSIVKKPWVFEGRIEIREILNLTVIFDHDVIDGAPAARFTSRLVKNIQTGHGL